MESRTASATEQCMEALRRYPSGVMRELASDDPMAQFPDRQDAAAEYMIHGKVMLDSIRMAMLAAHKEQRTASWIFPPATGAPCDS